MLSNPASMLSSGSRSSQSEISAKDIVDRCFGIRPDSIVSACPASAVRRVREAGWLRLFCSGFGLARFRMLRRFFRRHFATFDRRVDLIQHSCRIIPLFPVDSGRDSKAGLRGILSVAGNAIRVRGISCDFSRSSAKQLEALAPTHSSRSRPETRNGNSTREQWAATSATSPTPRLRVRSPSTLACTKPANSKICAIQHVLTTR